MGLVLEKTSEKEVVESCLNYFLGGVFQLAQKSPRFSNMLCDLLFSPEVLSQKPFENIKQQVLSQVTLHMIQSSDVLKENLEFVFSLANCKKMKLTLIVYSKL
jgi:hypothetical protein